MTSCRFTRTSFSSDSSRDQSTVDRPRSSRDQTTVDRPRSSRDQSTMDRPRSGFTCSLGPAVGAPEGGGELRSRQQRLLLLFRLLLLLLLQEQSFSSLGVDTTLLETQDVLLAPLEGREAQENQNQD